MDGQPLPEVEAYAAAVHTALACCYALSLPYHIKRKHPLRAAIHLGLSLYHIWSVKQHVWPGDCDAEEDY